MLRADRRCSFRASRNLMFVNRLPRSASTSDPNRGSFAATGVSRPAVIVVSIALAVVLAATAATSGAQAVAMPRHVETIRVDTGFRVKRDGFSFPNWGGLTTTDGLSAAHMVKLLGRAGRCVVDSATPTCILRNGFSVDLAHINEHLAQGRCEGMVVLAGRLFLGASRLRHVSQTAKHTFDLTLDEAADEIAYWWTTQLAPNVVFYSVRQRASSTHHLAHEILRRMRRKTMVTIGIYTPTWSHAVLAIRASYRADVSRFTVYDPNFPGETRVLVLDHRKNSWTYADALTPDGTLRTVSGQGVGGLDYVPVLLRSRLSGWEWLGGF